jgi:acetyl-CoA/propionyl-CoA carboxylase, biotin carboxylase, biotin carboxyl carrier protein
VPVEVNGKRFSVRLWLPDAPAGGGGGGNARRGPRPRPAANTGGGAGDGTIAAPMQGTIVKILVAEGDAVEAGQSVLVLEAMKMENHINAEAAGTVREIRVAAGDTVGTGDVLLVIE